jgi:hypothetical protein
MPTRGYGVRRRPLGHSQINNPHHIVLAVGLLALSLGGCGAGLLAKGILGNKNKDGATIVAAQEEAITAAHGGALNVPIAWTDRKTGVGGILQRTGDVAGCGKFSQAFTIGNETVRGTITACPDVNGSWHFQNNG